MRVNVCLPKDSFILAVLDPECINKVSWGAVLYLMYNNAFCK